MTTISRVLATRKSFRLTILIAFFIFLCFVVSSQLEHVLWWPAQAASSAQTTSVQSLFVLRFDGNLNSEQGQPPTQASTPLFQPGVNGQGVLVDRNTRLIYPSPGNIRATEGTIELWLKPSWEGTDEQSRAIFKYGTNGGILLSKEGTNLRFALNNLNENGGLELEVTTDIQNWVAGQWHYIAASWSNTGQFLRLYVDGTLMSERTLATNTALPAIDSTANPTMQLGGDGIRLPLVAVIDEVTISDAPRTLQDITTRMMRGITVNSATLTPATTAVTMYPGWSFWQDLRYTAETNIGRLMLPLQAASLTYSNPDIATTDPVTGRLRAVGPGIATITATLLGSPSVVTVTVSPPQQTVIMETIDTALSTPRSDALYQVPVAIIRYLPTTDGTNLNATATGFASTLAALKTKQTRVEKKLKFMLEEGSRFRGYANAAARASLGYKVVKIITVYEEIPPGLPSATSGVYFPDYKQIFHRLNVRDLVMTQGVKEIWLEQYVNGHITLNESNLASPLTPDISSSLRTNDDLPVYPKSYTVIGINYAQFENHAARHHGHHLEALLTFANLRQDRDDLLFQEAFIGRHSDGSFLPGRCGKTDRPPNSTSNFDFNNATAIESDIEDWWPEHTGVRKLVNNATWGQLSYDWPEPPTNQTESQWHIYWRQAIPGFNNQLARMGTERLTNWWHFAADWDTAIQSRLGLVEEIGCQYTLSSTSLSLANTGGERSVNIATTTGCGWSARSNATWLTIKSGSESGLANGTVHFTVAANAGAARTGTLTIQGQTVTITQAAVALVHPADLNDNLRLEINEFTAYGAAWKVGAAWNRLPSPIDINYLTNAGLLWKLGEIYHHDDTKSPPFAAGTSINRPQFHSASLPTAKDTDALTMTATDAPMTTSLPLLRAMGYMPGLGFGFTAVIADVLIEFGNVQENFKIPPVTTVSRFSETAPDFSRFSSTSLTMAPLLGGAVVASFSNANYVPGVGLTVTITVMPDAGTQVYAVEDSPPLGWAVSNVSHGGTFDSTNRKVKWGAFFDSAARSLTYVLTPPTGETGTKSFSGSASFDGVSVAVTGARTLPAAQLCNYTLSAVSQNFSALGGVSSFTIATPANCAWNATTASSWITLTQSNGSGNGAVNFTVAANVGAARVGLISVGGQIFSVNQSANATPTITPVAALTRQQNATATAVAIATISDAETPASNLVISTTFIPTGLSLTNLTNSNGTISAVVTASCLATPGPNTVGLRVTDVLGASAQANLTVNVTSSPNCFLQIADAAGNDQRLGSVLLFNYYTSSLGNAALENTQIRLTNTHETQDTAVRLYFVDAQTAAVFSLFVCLPPTQTFNFLMSETDPGVTGHIIAVTVNKNTGCPTNFNFLAGSASIKLSSGHVATLGAIAVAALATNPTTCASGNAAATLNFDGFSYSRLPRLLVVDNIGSLRDSNTTRLIVTRVGGSLMNTAGGLGTLTGKVYNSNRVAQDFTFSTNAPQFIGNLSASFPRLTTRLDNFILAGQSGWMKLWTDGNWGIIGSVLNVPANPRTLSAFVGGFNLQQGALANAVSLEVPISVPTCQ